MNTYIGQLMKIYREFLYDSTLPVDLLDDANNLICNTIADLQELARKYGK